jgi:hypothetical protein
MVRCRSKVSKMVSCRSKVSKMVRCRKVNAASNFGDTVKAMRPMVPAKDFETSSLDYRIAGKLTKPFAG